MAMTSEMHLRESGQSSGHRFDYRGMHRYLITLQTFKSSTVFTGKEVILRILDLLRESSWKFHFDIYAYCFLPDRMVMIAKGKEESSDMKAFLSSFRATSTEVMQPTLGHPLWKRTYMERVLRKTEDSKRVAEEVFQLPVRAGLAPSAADYEFQGSFVLRPTPSH